MPVSEILNIESAAPYYTMNKGRRLAADPKNNQRLNDETEYYIARSRHVTKYLEFLL